MTDTVLAQLAALKYAPTSALKAKWRQLFETEPPPYNRRFLESRLAYRVQELVAPCHNQSRRVSDLWSEALVDAGSFRRNP